MKQVIEIEVDVPDGFVCVGYGKAKRGDYIKSAIDLFDGLREWTSNDESSSTYFLFEKDTPPTVGSMVEASDDGVNWVKGELLKVLDGDDWHFRFVVWETGDEVAGHYSMVRPLAKPKWQLASMEDLGQKVFVVDGLYDIVPQNIPDYFNDPDKLNWILTDICPRSGRYAVETESGNRATYKTVYIRK